MQVALVWILGPVQGDILSVDGDADAAVEARIRFGWISSGSWYHCLPIRTYI